MPFVAIFWLSVKLLSVPMYILLYFVFKMYRKRPMSFDEYTDLSKMSFRDWIDEFK